MSDMLQVLEDKVIALVDELEGLRSKLQNALKETQEIKTQKEQLQQQVDVHHDKLQGILSLLNSVEAKDEEVQSVAVEVIETEAEFA